MLASHPPRNQVQQLVIADSQAGQRIDNFLLTFFRGVPKSRVYRIIRKGEVRVNKKRVDVSYRLVLGDSLRIPPVRMAEVDEKQVVKPNDKFIEFLESSILFEDESLIILNKPSGLAVHGGSGIKLGAIEAFRAMRPKAPFLELVHRLDRDTSGCLMIAKKRSRLTYLNECLKQGTIVKRYVALVQDKWKGGKIIDAPLHKYLLLSGERRVKVDSEGKFAKTGIKILESFKEATLVQATPHTGRTHQIRVHCAHVGNPILGDEKYGNKDHNIQASRLYLHARELLIPIEGSENKLALTAPIPDEFQSILSILRNED